MRQYFRPIVQSDPVRPEDAVPLAGGPLWFSEVECLRRDGVSQLVPAGEVPEEVLARISAGRAPVCGMSLDRPRLMGILNVTPDSFSDGGEFHRLENALAQAEKLINEGADIIDIGGESTRPGAVPVSESEEIRRVVPVIEALRARGASVPVSIDTRKAAVARRAVAAGAGLFNDVSALSHDPSSMAAVAELGVPVCLMHASGDPETMQGRLVYVNVLLDVFDYLEKRVFACVEAGIPRERIIVDPGIGFGKTAEHNLALIRGVSLFHGLGCAILMGASRKRFIGTIGGESQADRRAPGSIAVGLEALRQGVQILRVHDMAQTAQAVALWRHLVTGQQDASDDT